MNSELPQYPTQTPRLDESILAERLSRGRRIAGCVGGLISMTGGALYFKYVGINPLDSFDGGSLVVAASEIGGMVALYEAFTGRSIQPADSESGS